MDLIPHKLSPKDVFLHLLTMVTLYVSVISFLVLVFNIVNLTLPDVLEIGQEWAITSARESIRWALSLLIVFLPVYAASTYYLHKSYQDHSYKKNLAIRKWLIYFTLFLAGIMFMVDIATLVNILLKGELTLRFVLKVLAVLFVAGSVFWYYLWELKTYKPEES